MASRARFYLTMPAHADPDDASARIDLTGVLWLLLISEEPPAAPGGRLRAYWVSLEEHLL